MKGIYNFYWCCDYGEIDSIFCADKEEVEKLIGKMVNFGEALGKHSEVYGKVNEEDIELIVDENDLEFYNKLYEAMNSIMWVGRNPLQYVCEDESEEE